LALTLDDTAVVQVLRALISQANYIEDLRDALRARAQEPNDRPEEQDEQVPVLRET
jgi:hypothetical protein